MLLFVMQLIPEFIIEHQKNVFFIAHVYSSYTCYRFGHFIIQTVLLLASKTGFFERIKRGMI